MLISPTQLKLVLLACLCFCLSCSPKYYIPTNEVITHLEAKGDFEGTIQYGGYFVGLEGFQVDVGYAVSDKIGVLGAVSTARDLFSLSEFREITTGIGYIHQIDSTLFLRNFLIVDFGNFSSYQLFGMTAKARAYSLQLGITKKFLENGRASFSMDIKHLRYRDIMADTMNLVNAEELTNARNNILLEPTLGFSLGGDHIKCNFQFSYASNLSNPDLAQRNSFMMIGATVNLNFLDKDD